MDFIRAMMNDIDEAEGKGEGYKFTWWLFAMYSGLKGFYSQSITNTMAPYLRDELGLDNVWVSEWTSFKRLPWNLKPGYAFLSDIQPLFGYKKRFYVFIFGMIGVLAIVPLILLPNETLRDTFRPNTGTFAGILFFLTHLNAAAVDTLTQGRYTVLVKAVGASVVTFVYFNQNAAQMIVTAYTGPVNDINPKINLWIAFPFGLQMFIFAALNYMGDPPAATQCKPDVDLLRKQQPTFVLAIVQILVSIVLVLMSLFDEVKYLFGDYTRMWFIIVASAIIVSGAFMALPPVIAKCNMYMYMCKFMQLSASSALLFFYTKPRDTDSWAPCPDNPQLDYTLYQTYGGFVNKAVVLLAIVLFQMYIQHWKARTAMWVTTVFTIIAAIFDIAIVERWNRDYLGIPDSVGYLFGSVAIEGLVDQLDDMPIYMLISKLCPKDVETTVFAILTANTNLGGTVAGYLATDAQKWLGLEYSKKACSNPEYTVFGMTFTALSWILIVGDIILPLLTIPLTFVLIPDVQLNGDWASVDSDLGAREIQMSDAAEFEAGLNQGEPSAPPVPKGSSALLQEQSGAETIMTTLAYTRGNSKIDRDVL